MTEPCPRDCGKPSTPRHTCIQQPDDPEEDRPYGNHLRDVMLASVALRRFNGHGAAHCKNLANGLESGRLIIVEASELAEKQRIARLEDALRYAIRLLEDEPPNVGRIGAFLPSAKELLP